jgi:anti-sigma factor RsiW
MSEERPITEADLNAYVDRQAAGERCAEVEAWLASRPEEAERVADYRRLNEELRAAFDPVLDEPVPRGLERTARRRWSWRPAAVAAGLVAFGAVLGVAGDWALRESRAPAAAAPEASSLVRRAVVAHATYAPEVRHPVEVGADQEAHLVAWLSKRLGAPVRAPKLESVGYSLVGGRLLPGERGPTAQFMYQCKMGTRVTLYLRTDVANNRETAFRYAQDGNVRVFYWVDRKLGYALSSSDISKDDLNKVANAVYQQLNP